MSCEKFDPNTGDQVCCFCGAVLDENDDLAMETGYCSDKCYVESAGDEEGEDEDEE